eukprot:5689151-Alexandrium_andersonii.AAC.1
MPRGWGGGVHRRRVCYMRSHGGLAILHSAVPCTGVFEAWGRGWDSSVGAWGGGLTVVCACLRVVLGAIDVIALMSAASTHDICQETCSGHDWGWQSPCTE